MLTAQPVRRDDAGVLLVGRRRVLESMGELREELLTAVDEATLKFVGRCAAEEIVGFEVRDEASAVGVVSVADISFPPSRRNLSGRCLWVYGLWVEPRARRQGVARVLMLAVEAEASRRGAAVLLRPTLDAEPLYEALSYRRGVLFER